MPDLIEPASQPLIQELSAMVNRMSSRQWKRLRIAVTHQELMEIKEWVKNNNPEADAFYHAIRGVPLIVEESPTELHYIMEPM